MHYNCFYRNNALVCLGCYKKKKTPQSQGLEEQKCILVFLEVEVHSVTRGFLSHLVPQALRGLILVINLQSMAWAYF